MRPESYDRLHGAAGEVDEGLYRKVLLGISCRDYEAAVEAVPGAIGLSKSTVSREFKKATARQLKAFQERDLSRYDVVAVVLDGKSFAEDQMVLALGTMLNGDKVFLGFVQTDTENARAIKIFLRGLVDRGLDLSAGALVVIDGSKGLKAGAEAAELLSNVVDRHESGGGLPVGILSLDLLSVVEVNSRPDEGE